MTARRRRAMRLVTLAASTLLALAAAEGLMRLFWGGFYLREDAALHAQPNAVLGWENTAGSSFVFRRAEFSVAVRHERHGFRSAAGDVPERKPEGRLRAACIGDSYMWGFGAGDAESIPARLEALEPRIEAIDMGVAGYGPHQELATLRRKALPLAPDLVVWQLCLNDIDNLLDLDLGYGVDARGDLTEGVPVARGPRLETPRRYGPVMRWVALLQRWSYLARASVDTAKQLWVKAIGRGALPEMDPARREGAMRLFRALLRAGAEDCRSRGARLLLVLVPMRFQIYHEPDRGPRPREFAEAIDRIAREAGIALLDLEAPLREAAKAPGGALYFVVDGHLTPRGYDAAARIVLSDLRARGWAPPAAAER